LSLVFFSNRYHFSNLLVHKWLGKWGIVKFIVSTFPISNEVYYDVIFEFHSVLCGNCKNFCNIINAFCIHMEDWSINSLSNVCAIYSRSGFVRSSCEPDLIIDNNMDASTNSIVLEVSHLQCFIYNTLACKCSITMNSNRYDFVTIFISH